MQPGRAQTSGLGVPLLPLARWAGWAAPVQPNLRGVVRCALSLCRSRCVCVCNVMAHFAPVHWCARPLCSMRGVGGHVAPVPWCARCVRYLFALGGFFCDCCLLCFSFSSFCVCCVFVFFRFGLLLLLCFSFEFFYLEKGALAHCRHRHGQLVQQCSSVGSFVVVVVRCRCLVGGRASEVPLARLDLHGCGSGLVRLGVSLRFA